MRIIRLAVLAAALACAPAFAQKASDQSSVVHPGAQRFLHAMLVETGAFDQIAGPLAEALAPTLHKYYLEPEWAARLDDQKREKLTAFVDTLPARYFAVLKEHLPQIEYAAAVAFSEQTTAEECEQMGEFFSSEDGLAISRVMAASAFASRGKASRSEAVDAMTALTPGQMDSLMVFSRSPGGKAFVRVGWPGKDLMENPVLMDWLSKAAPKIRAEVRSEACAIIGEPCPLH